MMLFYGGERKERERGKGLYEKMELREVPYIKYFPLSEIQAKQEPHKTSSHPVLSPLPTTERKWFIGS